MPQVQLVVHLCCSGHAVCAATGSNLKYECLICVLSDPQLIECQMQTAACYNPIKHSARATQQKTLCHHCGYDRREQHQPTPIDFHDGWL